MPRILPFKDPEPEEINGFKDITEAVNFLDIIIQCDGQSINNKEHFCFTHRTIEPHEERRVEYSDGRTEMGCYVYCSQISAEKTYITRNFLLIVRKFSKKRGFFLVSGVLVW